MSLYPHREWLLFHKLPQIAQQFFYSSPEWANQVKLGLPFFEATIEEGDMWDLQPATSPLDATKFYTLDI